MRFTLNKKISSVILFAVMALLCVGPAATASNVQSPDTDMVQFYEAANQNGCFIGTPLVYRNGNDYICHTRLSSDYASAKIYLASYKEDESLFSCEISEAYAVDEEYAYFSQSMPYNKEISYFKAFLWNDDLAPVTYDSQVDASYIITEDFENVSQKSATGNEYPTGWNIFYWAPSGGYHMTSGFGMSTDTFTQGTHSAYLNDIPAAYCGFTTKIESTLDSYSYDFSFDVMVSEGAAAEPAVWLQLYDTDKSGKLNFKKMIKAKIDDYDHTNHGWQTVTAHIANSDLWSWDYDSFTLVVGISHNSQKTFESADNKVYFDNFKMSANEQLKGIKLSRIASDSFASWYTKSEEVTYTFSEGTFDEYSSVKGTVYDIDNNIIFENTISASEAKENGFTFTPENVGYYEIEFKGIHPNGVQCTIADGYLRRTDSGSKIYAVPRLSFAVVDADTKDMSQRNEALLFSDSCKSAENLALADLVGFSGVRIHTIDWGTTASEFSKGFHTAVGTYDWTMPDEQITNAEDKGFNTIIPNIVFTPQWAVTDEIDNTGNSIVGAKPRNLYAPKDMQNLTDAMTAFTTRYADRIDGIEFWNEPYYGETSKTAFWHDTASKYSDMQIAASKAIKSADADMPVIAAGHFGGTHGSTFLNDMLKNEEYKNSFDILSYHGRYNISDNYKNVLNWYNLYNIPMMNSEGYYYSFLDSTTHIRDFGENNLMILMCYFKEIKDNIKFITHFNICDTTLNSQNEYIADTLSGYGYGLFRKHPSYMPYPGAVVLHNFFELMGTDFSYDAEYDFDGVKAVSFNNDGKKLVALWNSKGNNFALPEDLKALVNDSSGFIDFEGKQTDVNTTLNWKKLYYIVGADESTLKNLTSKNGAALNKTFTAPYYNCQGTVIDDVVTSSFIAKDGTMVTPEYINDAFSWVGKSSAVATEAAPAMDISYEDNGIRFIINVTDDSVCQDATKAGDIAGYDCVKLAFDGYGNGFSNERNEFWIGVVSGNPTLYKYYAADTYAGLIDDFSESKTVLDSDNLQITSTESGITYNVLIPYVEMFPYRNTEAQKKIRASIAVVDVDTYLYFSKQEQGAWCFGEGLYNVDANPARYGEIITKTIEPIDVNANITDSVLYVTGTVHDDVQFVNIVINCNQTEVYSGDVAVLNGIFTVQVPITSIGTYTILATGELTDGSTSGYAQVEFLATVGVAIPDYKSKKDITVVIYKDDEIYNIMQIDDASNMTEITFPAATGTYLVHFCDANGTVCEKTITVE